MYIRCIKLYIIENKKNYEEKYCQKNKSKKFNLIYIK